MAAPWTARKRVETALDHREPDRVPVDFCITLEAYKNLREHLQLSKEPKIQHDRFFEVRPSLDLLKALDVDMTFVRLQKPSNWKAPPPLADGSELDEWGVGRKLVELANGAQLFEVTFSPWEDLNPEDIDLDSYSWPDPHAPGRTDGLEKDAQELWGTGLALMGRFGGPILDIGAYLRGFQQWLMDLVLASGNGM